VTDISWLTNHRLAAVVKNDYNWDFRFSADVNLRAECLWRLIEAGHIRFTSQDHGQLFGLKSPVDCVAEVNQRVTGSAVNSVAINEVTLDLSVTFQSGHILQLIPESSGYEAWQLGGRGILIIAVGGGRLDVFRSGPESGG
jgi:hypothetical protein